MKGHQLPHSNKETLTIGWCDNGMVDGKFAEGIAYTQLMAPSVGVPINSLMRVKGNQLVRQRQDLFDKWADEAKTDWLLCIDSDVVLTKELLKTLWDTADKIARPVVSGVYFIWKDTVGTLPVPIPALFWEGTHKYQIKSVLPLPENQVIEVDSAGLGLVLLHKSIIPALRAKFGDDCLYTEEYAGKENFVGEDIIFFRKVKEVGFKIHAHTGAVAAHMKTFPFDLSYYAMFWTLYNKAQTEEESKPSE